MACKRTFDEVESVESVNVRCSRGRVVVTPAVEEFALWSAAGRGLGPVEDVVDLPSGDEGEYLSSGDEEFTSLDHYFELRDSDRGSLVGLFVSDRESLVGHTHNMDAHDFEGYWRGVFADRMRFAGLSECYRRREMFKVHHRFMSREGYNRGFRQFMDRLFPRVPGETWYTWLGRLKLSRPVLFWKLCVLHDLDHHFNLELEDCPDLSVRLMEKRREYMCLDVYLGIQRANRSFQRALRTADELTEEEALTGGPAADAGTADGAAARRRVQLLCKFSSRRLSSRMDCTYLPTLFKFDLLLLLEMESRDIWQCVQAALDVIHLSASSPAGLLLYRYLYPDYSQRPVRGPFRAGYVGFSQLDAMYGPFPDRQFYYCNCVNTGDYCGHPSMSRFLRVPDDDEE